VRSDGDGQRFVLDPSIVASDAHRFVELLRYARSLDGGQAAAVYEEALALYTGDLLDSPDVPGWDWLYDGPRIAIELRADYRRMQLDARRRLAELLAAGSEAGDLRRAQELYVCLSAEQADNEQLWTELYRVHGRRRDVLGLEASVRRLRSALVEFGSEEEPERVPLPPGLEEVICEVRAHVGTTSSALV
jgi:hypothetical protein